MSQRDELTTLINKYDQDPGSWRPLVYPVTISVPVTEGGTGTGSITTNNQGFIWRRFAHQIIGNTGDPASSGLYNDGQYTVEYQDEITNYQSGPVMADLLGGSVRSGFACDLAMPIPFAGTRTITFKLVNQYTRVLTPEADYFKVQVAMIGVADIDDWGNFSRQR